MSQTIGVVALNTETESGSTNPVIGGGISSDCAPSISAGSDASDELELNATVCAGSAARVNRGSGIRPASAASG